MGTTPVDLPFPKGDDILELAIRLDGYDDATAPFYPTVDQALSVTLKKKKPGRVLRPSRRPPGDKGRPDPHRPGGGELEPSPYDKKR
jgi:hypothetical protein